MNRRVLISGCSGGGKSSLLAELGARGHAVVVEPGRRIVAEERAAGGAALPWIDHAAFARRALAMALDDHARVEDEGGWTFFDRGIVDAAVALAHATGDPPDRAAATHRYRRTVFLAPPWPEIFVGDAERRHGFEVAIAEYGRLAAALPTLGYAPIVLPRVGVAARAGFVLDALA